MIEQLNILGNEISDIVESRSALSESDGYLRIESLILSDKTSDWCRLPYYNHPTGCPNFGKKSTCPPQAPKIQDVIDIDKPMYLVYSEFNLEEHKSRMKELHPDWTEYQCKCVLYWQPKSRVQMMERVKRAMKTTGCNYITTCPEAMGVNLYATAKIIGLILDPIQTMKICRHIALIGIRR